MLRARSVSSTAFVTSRQSGSVLWSGGIALMTTWTRCPTGLERFGKGGHAALLLIAAFDSEAGACPLASRTTYPPRREAAWWFCHSADHSPPLAWAGGSSSLLLGQLPGGQIPGGRIDRVRRRAIERDALVVAKDGPAIRRGLLPGLEHAASKTFLSHRSRAAHQRPSSLNEWLGQRRCA
jgi:hypothetical protein